MKNKHYLLALFICLIFSTSILAHPDSLPKTWSGNVHFGYAANSGNSRDTSGLGKLDLRYKPNEKWQIGGLARGQFSTGKKGKTSQNANIAGDAHYYFIPHQFAFTLLDYQYDRFSPYIYSTLAVIGYGWDIFDSKKIHLSLRAGPGYRHQKEATSKETDTDLVAYAKGIFRWKLSKTVEFNQSVSYEHGNSNAYTQTKTALITKIIGNLSFEASFLLKHYSKVPKFSKNKYNTDSTTNLALVYEF